MQSSLINIIWLSEKRRKLLLYLKEGPKNIEEIKASFSVTSRFIVPEIKKLIKKDIIIEENELYSLSNIGELITENMQSLLNTENLIEQNNDYWENNDLSSIPKNLYQRIGDLRNNKLYEFEVEDVFEPPEQLMMNVRTAQNIMLVMPFIPPPLFTIFSEPLEKGVKMSIVFTKPIFEKLKMEYPKELNEYLGSKNVDMFICDGHVKIPMIVVMDNFLLMGFFNKNGIYGNSELMSYDENAIEWAKELFLYYKNESKKLIEI